MPWAALVFAAMSTTPFVRGARWTVALVAVALVATGCTPSPAKPTASATGTPSVTATPTATPTPVAIPLSPLRGTPLADAKYTGTSLAAKIDNLSVARPQVGLEKTDIVFEELVEGGLTRYVAIWQSDIPKEIGPVRSIRPMDPDILSSFGGIVAYSGGQARFVALMQKAPVFNAIHGQAATADTFYRTANRTAPHNVIVRAQKLVGQHKNIKAPAQQFTYATATDPATATTAGTLTTSAKLVFSNVSTRTWVWNGPLKVWQRSQDGAKDYDSNKKQIQAKNVVILRVGINNSLGVPKTDLIGNGEAVIMSGGSRIAAKWSKTKATSKIALVDKTTNQPILLNPGNTWVEMVPATKGKISYVSPAPAAPATPAPTPTP